MTPITYVTFGQAHRHVINGEVFDKDCVARVHGDRDEVFRIFGPKFAFEYPAEDAHRYIDMSYYPRGLIEVQP